jgi:hypothetical protein
VRDLKLKVVQLPINLIKDRPENARTHSRKQIARLASAIRSFGFVVPVVPVTRAPLTFSWNVDPSELTGSQAEPKKGIHIIVDKPNFVRQPIDCAWTCANSSAGTCAPLALTAA